MAGDNRTVPLVLGVYYLGNESVKIALSAGATTVGVLALDAGLGCALVAGGRSRLLWAWGLRLLSIF